MNYLVSRNAKTFRNDVMAKVFQESLRKCSRSAERLNDSNANSVYLPITNVKQILGNLRLSG